MWSVQNGILYQDDTPVFAVGVSYYASYRADKVPVPPDGDRLIEMQKDLRRMVECGFNIVRFAALGEIHREGDEVVADTAFTDQLMHEADCAGIATMLRLQGYTMNLSGYDDCYMIDEKGRQIDRSIWYNFIQNCLHHQGILKDNADGTAYLAAHYRQFQNLVAYQTYNEPHYPSGCLFDYHPDAIAAYRRYLVEKGYMTAATAADYDPPRHYPHTTTEREPWARWRQFCMDSHSAFLADTARVAKNAAPQIASLTCLTTCPVQNKNSLRGVNYYDNARDMDILGITHYIGTHGPSFFSADMVVNFAECAAAYYGKHCWIVEYDARTDIPDRKLNEETYLALGAGIKGILYYQWRGDYPAPGAPEANGFGFTNYDGTPAENFENGMQMVQFLHRFSDKLTAAEKYRSPVGLLYSDHAYFCGDTETPIAQTGNVPFQQTAYTLQNLYTACKKQGVTPTIVNGDAVADNRFGIRVLLIPEFALLSDEEKATVRAFIADGGVAYYREDYGLVQLDAPRGKYAFSVDISDILRTHDIVPPVTVSAPQIITNMVVGDGYRILSVNNIAADDAPITAVQLQLHFPATRAVFCTPQGDTPLTVQNSTVTLPPITHGGLVVIE